MTERRGTQEIVEVAGYGASQRQGTQVITEIVGHTNPERRCSQVICEVLMPVEMGWWDIGMEEDDGL